MGNAQVGQSHPVDEVDVDTEDGRRELQDELLKHVDDKIFLDSSRRDLLSIMAFDIVRLVSGQLEGLNRYNLLILGRKSIGKTTLLEVAESACTTVLGDRVAVVSIEASRDADQLKHGLFLFVARAIGCPVAGFLGLVNGRPSGDWAPDGPLSKRIKLLSAFVKQSKKKVVVFVDELQEVYTDDYTSEESKLVLRELQNLVGLAEGLFYVVATGNSSYLLTLAFCEMKIEDAHAKGMIHYSGARDLNSTKLRPMWIGPIGALTQSETET
jgi:AAA+ ATPase superfamily predicted ATPase